MDNTVNNEQIRQVNQGSTDAGMNRQVNVGDMKYGPVVQQGTFDFGNAAQANMTSHISSVNPQPGTLSPQQKLANDTVGKGQGHYNPLQYTTSVAPEPVGKFSPPIGDRFNNAVSQYMASTHQAYNPAMQQQQPAAPYNPHQSMMAPQQNQSQYHPSQNGNTQGFNQPQYQVPQQVYQTPAAGGFQSPPPAGTSNFQQLQEQNKGFAYDPTFHYSTGPNTTTPLSANASVQSYGGKFNAPPQEAGVFPYQVTCADYGGRNVFLFDISPKILLLVYDGELQLSVDDSGTNLKKSYDAYNTPYGEKRGYVFWKQTKKYLDCLDKLFTPEWRKNIKVELPVITDHGNDVLLASGTYNGVPYEVYEYSQKSVVLFIHTQMPIGMSNNFTHKDKGKIPGYTFSKKGARGGVAELEKLLNVPLSDKYEQSEKVFTSAGKGPAQQIASQPTIIKTGICLIGGTQHTVEQWRFSEASYALTFTPEANIENEIIKYNPGLHFGSVRRGGYIFAKNNLTAMTHLKVVFPEAISDDIIANTAMPQFPTSAPRAEPRLSELAMNMMTKLSKVTTVEEYNEFGKRIIYGPTESIDEELISNATMKIHMDGVCLIICKND
jgi:hypothetical protein